MPLNNISRIVVEDAPALAALYAKCFEKPWSETDFQGLIATGAMGWKASFLPLALGEVGEQSEAAEGIFAFILLRPAADEAEILTLATHPDSRRKGLAENLLTTAEPLLALENVAGIFLEVRVDNFAAQKLYEKCGFRIVATRKNYYHLQDGSTLDAVVMKKELALR